ncbi:MAG: WecB/TagA/CpsF family glycosyltransferase [Roseovarius sp.]
MQFSISDHVVTINIPSFERLAAATEARLAAGEGFALATLNLDHLAKMAHDEAFARAYGQQDMIVADGNPIVALSRIAGQPVELLPGSDLILPLCRIAAKAGSPVALVGSDEPTLAAAAQALEAEVPGLRIVLRHPPAMGFDPEGSEAQEIFRRLSDTGAKLCFVALGAPKQERFAAAGRAAAPGVGFVSIGAGLDFIAGSQRRAPVLVRRIAMEWFWRMCSDFKRLGPRYARCFAILPGQVLNALRLRASGR